MRRLYPIFVLLVALPLWGVSVHGNVLAQRPNTMSAEVVSIDGAEYFIHMVVEGETLASLSRLYGVGVADIVDDNTALFDPARAERTGFEQDASPHEGYGQTNSERTEYGQTSSRVGDESLRIGREYAVAEVMPGQVLKIRCLVLPEPQLSRRRYNRTFEEHLVMSGETTYSIAKRYMLPLQVLVDDNPGLDPAVLRSGQILRIRKSEKGEGSPQTILNEAAVMSKTLNMLSDDYFYYTVEDGDTVYSLSRQWNVEESVINESYDVANGLHAGDILKIPVDEAQGVKYRLVEVPLDGNEPPQGYDRQDYHYDGKLGIAMLLPLTGGDSDNFVEFYQGALLALEEVKAKGYSLHFDLFDTGRSPQITMDILRSGALDDIHLIIGPVYEDEFRVVADWAKNRRIPIVSPLSELEESYYGSVYQMSPAHDSRYRKMREMFEGDKNIIVVSSEVNDNEFERYILDAIGQLPYERLLFTSRTSSRHLESLIAGSQSEAVIIVTSRSDSDVARTLATISSIQNSRRARSMSMPPVRVVGNSSWLRYSAVDRNLFFKLNVTFTTSYHFDRNNSAVNEFEKRYIVSFGTLPSPYSFRGYDAVKIFASAMLGVENTVGEVENSSYNRYSDFNDRLDATMPIQTGYSFRPSQRGYMENVNWPLVIYRDNYSIEVR